MQNESSQDRRLVKTGTPGIYKRGSRYVVVFRDPNGRQRKRSARTLAEARDLKAALTADVKRGEYRTLSKLTFAEYATEWIETYTGRTSSGIRQDTLERYRRQLGLDKAGSRTGGGAIAFFGRMHLAAIEPRDVKRYASELAATGLSKSSVKKQMAPVRAMLADACEEGLIRSNPAAGIRLMRAEPAEDASDERVKALSEEELLAILSALSEEWRLFFEFLTHTGLRISEAIALRWEDVDLGRQRIHVRRRIYRGRIDAPKSKFGRRTIPLSRGLARALWNLKGSSPDEALIFASPQGYVLNTSNTMNRILKPAAIAAGVWLRTTPRGETTSEVGFHAFRHTCATMLFRNGLNAKQVQMWLGHHSAAFTLETYVHLLPDDLPDPAFLDTLTAGSGPAAGLERAAIVAGTDVERAGSVSVHLLRGACEQPRARNS